MINADQNIRSIVIGATGYSGAELVALLAQHPNVDLIGLFGSESRESSTPFGELYPRWRSLTDLFVNPLDFSAIIETQPDLVFLATPHEASHDLAPQLLAHDIVVVDVSAAFRLTPASQYDQHYGFTHKHPDLLENAAYGLCELNRERIAQADLIACPGCYPTSAILPLHPLVKHGMIAPDTRPIVDSTSGVSGAGRAPSAKVHFCEVSLQPYGVLSHRHNPEIDQHAGVPVVFTPHLGAYERGILSTSHVELNAGVDTRTIASLYQSTYANESFVRLLPQGQWPSVAATRYSNFCDIGWAVDDVNHHLIVVSSIDNLVKGAAGQAVQCMNIRFGMAETTGLRKEAACQVQ